MNWRHSRGRTDFLATAK